MFRYKICYECKIWFIGFLLIHSILILAVYAIYHNQAPIIAYLTLLLSVCPVTFFSYYHYRDHQRVQFNKIKNKFGVK